jgi:hypothetical protein
MMMVVVVMVLVLVIMEGNICNCTTSLMCVSESCVYTRLFMKTANIFH